MHSEELVSFQDVAGLCLNGLKIVSVADRADATFLPAVKGCRPVLEIFRSPELLRLTLLSLDICGEIEFDPVGQTVSSMGYEELLASLRQYVDDVQN